MREILFQRLWLHHAFDAKNLLSTCGLPVEIHRVGTLNNFDGPDFSNGYVRIGSKYHEGAIELHVNCNDWYKHGHQHDPAYNTVALHVCLNAENASPVVRQDKKQVPTVVLKPHLHPKWQVKLLEIHQHRELTCAGFLSNISDHVVQNQLQKASELYFSIKRDTMLSSFDAHRIPSDAFLRMFWIHWCDGLGIPANREPMKLLASRSWDYTLQTPASLQQCNSLLQSLAAELDSGFEANPNSRPVNGLWRNKNGRPANQRGKRLQEAAKMFQFLKNEGFGWFVRRSVHECFSDFSLKKLSSAERNTVLLHTVLLPALHILGNLIYKPQLCRDAEESWITGNIPVPKGVKKAYEQGGGNMKIFSRHTGTLPQHRYFCAESKCEDCFIFKNIVRG